jgi:hypothetical protein
MQKNIMWRFFYKSRLLSEIISNHITLHSIDIPPLPGVLREIDQERKKMTNFLLLWQV